MLFISSAPTILGTNHIKNKSTIMANVAIFLTAFFINPPQYSIFISLEFPAESPFYLEVSRLFNL